MMRWLWAPLIALQFLTRIPVIGIPDSAYTEGGARRQALVYFPAVGLLVGGVGAAIWLVAHWLHFSALTAAILTVTATAAITGAFHEDGLADTADALGTYTREDALRVMRDSRIGTFGAVALWTALTLKVSALSGTNPTQLPLMLMSAHVLARWSSLPLAVLLPYARDREGLGAGLAALATWREVLLATIESVASVVLLMGAHGAGICFGITVVIAAATGAYYRKRFGGITGDCLGATNQLVEVAVLLAGTVMR